MRNIVERGTLSEGVRSIVERGALSEGVLSIGAWAAMAMGLRGACGVLFECGIVLLKTHAVAAPLFVSSDIGGARVAKACPPAAARLQGNRNVGGVPRR